MSDITMCKGVDCPLKESCYRYKTKANPYRQSYFIETPYNKETNACDHYGSIHTR